MIESNQKSVLRRQSTFKALSRRRDTLLQEERRMSQMSSDQNDSTIGSNRRPISWMLLPKSSVEMKNSGVSHSLRGLPNNSKNEFRV